MMNCPVDKVDDIIVLGMGFLLCLLFAAFGQWDVAQSIANNLMGALAMYVKGQS